MTEKRQSPDKILQRLQEEEREQKRGKLKIYLGAAPGVGKTYSMLQDALAKRSQGVDVLVGVVESHGRSDIESFLSKLDILPKQTVIYRDRELKEFDLDSALKRHPGLILMDEMAHTNVPGLRHVKRWQDIKELLDRGINVYTTLNVQHIESLNDDVSHIIHAPVKETVPDSMIQMADTIELVDLPPEDLLKRLKEGKVYIPAQAEIAAKHFFLKGNLTALRELALRVTAERVGAQVLHYRQGQGIKHIWPTQDKILVCVGPGDGSVKLIRAACRMATSLKAKWVAVYVDTPRLQKSEDVRNHAIQNLELAEKLGADTRVLTGFDIVNEVMNFAREQNVTQIMIWKYIRTRWWNLFFNDLADKVVRHSGEIDVYIMTGTLDPLKAKKVKPKKATIPWVTYLISIVIVSLATLFGILLFPYITFNNLILVYLLAVIIVALFGRIGPSIFAAVLSVFAYYFLFVPPFNEFIILDADYFITLFSMIIISYVVTHLISLNRQQTESAKFIEWQATALHTLSRRLASTRGINKLLDAGVLYISELFNSDVVALLPGKNDIEIRAVSGAMQALDIKEKGVAQWVYEMGQFAGLGTDTLSLSDSLYAPLVTSQGTIGVLRLHPRSKRLFSPEQIHLLEACANQLALAVEADSMQEIINRSELRYETDRVRNTLLQAFSHDLRTPLIAIMAAANMQIGMADDLDTKTIEKIGKDIYSESEQLNHLISNLLQIAYLESDTIQLQKKPSSIQNLIALTCQTSSKKLEKRPVEINVPDNLPQVYFDDALIQEVLINLIDNVVKYTPSKSPIEISAAVHQNKIIVSIEDHGPGIMPDEIKKLFEKFYRGKTMGSAKGLGLGLTICNRIIKAHGGEIWAENRKEGGAAFRFSLPIDGSL